jgi:2-dehydro-3-deoxygluconokinase
MKKVLSFGELLLRLSPDTEGKWIKDHMMPVYLGGAELNVANALANWKIPVAYCTALPDNYLSKTIQTDLNGKGVDTSRIISGGDRIGIYYLAQGTDLKNAGVIYDRANSSTAQLQPGAADWDKIFSDISWFHFSAISPAVSENLALVCKEALQAAHKKGITISVDLNYRAKLWKWGKDPVEVMPELVAYCDLVMGNIWAIENMLGIRIDEDLTKGKEAYVRQAKKSSELVINQFPQCTQVANTFRFDQQEGLLYYSTLYAGGELYVSREYTPKGIVDKVGSGDCYMAGLIYGNFNDQPSQGILEFATAAAVDKLFILGDATTSSAEQIMSKYLDTVK